MNKTTIEWTDYTWNPVTGCTKVSQGCKFCYAEGLFKRFGDHVWGHKFTNVTMHPERVIEPNKMIAKIRGKKVFVCDMSDLFHEKVTDQFIARVFRTMSQCPDTIFQVLTKRVERAVEFYSKVKFGNAVIDMCETFGLTQNGDRVPWPLPNVWIGTSCEDQKTADERIPLLLQIPAAVRFLSCEPLLGPIDISSWLYPKEFIGMPVESYDERWHSNLQNDIHWVIAGGESGHKARPMHPDWARSLRDQCAAAGVPFFFKQWGEYVSFEETHDDEGTWYCAAEKEHGAFDNLSIAKTFCHLGVYFDKLGKHKSGNFLDGKQHIEFPSCAKASEGRPTTTPLVQTEPIPGPSDD